MQQDWLTGSFVVSLVLRQAASSPHRHLLTMLRAAKVRGGNSRAERLNRNFPEWVQRYLPAEGLMLRRFVELHGDRAGLDDPAMVCGLASMGGVSFMFIGHQKGRNTKVPPLTPCPPDLSHVPQDAVGMPEIECTISQSGCC